MPESENAEVDIKTAQNVPEEAQKSPNPTNKKPKAIVILLVVLVFGLLGALAYLYSDRSNSTSNLETEVAQLKQAAIDVASATGIKDAIPIEEVEVVTPCSEGSNYTASIGNFTATLDSPYVIIRNLDAGFEGGPITSLNVASCLVDETNVYDSPPQSEVSILAHPANSSTDLRTSYESLNGSLTADGTVVIDGVTANKYVASGLFNTKVVYFDNAEIGYQIELSDTNTTTNAILTDLITDWSFTP